MEGDHNNRKPATINLYPAHQQVITTVTVHPDEPPPTSATPGVTYVQLSPGYFRSLRGILLLIEIVSRIKSCRFIFSKSAKTGKQSYSFYVSE